MINDIGLGLYRMTQRNMMYNGQGKTMPFSEKQLLLLIEHEEPYVVDLSQVINLPPIEFVNALYILFYNTLNDRLDDWKRLANSVHDDEFKRIAIENFLSSEIVKKYNIQVINNPYEQKGDKKIHLFSKL